MPHRYIKTTILVLVVTLFLCCHAIGCTGQDKSSQPNSPGPGVHTFTVTVGGLQRDYVVHVPSSYDEETGLPVVMMFHGGGGTAKASMRKTGWVEKAEQERFLAVFPEGSRADPSSPAKFSVNPQSWNDGSNRINVGAVARKAADVDFVHEMIDELCLRFKVDERRIYATGFSNGASMTFRVGRELSKTLAAIAPVAGSDWSKQATIARPIPMSYITGTADSLNPIDGGEIRIGSKEFGKKPPVSELIQKWVQLLGCPYGSHIVYDQDGVKGIAYGPCKGGSEVILYTIEQMGHAWPGEKSFLPESLVGKSSDSIKATDVIWNFFQKHPVK